VVAFSALDQKEILKVFSLSFWSPDRPDLRPRSFQVIVFLSVSILLLTLFFMRQIKIKRYGFSTVHYLKLRSLIKKKGGVISSASTPSGVARAAYEFGINEPIMEFIAIYEASRFGGRELTVEDRARYLRLLKEIKNRMKS
jgi:hypothetical protein